jgi:hypothetical protein
MLYYGEAKVSFYKLEAKGTDELSATPLIQEEYNRINLPTSESPSLKVDPSVAGVGFRAASPLYHDGLLYTVGNYGNLAVIDTQKTKQKDALVYTCFPPFDFKNPYSRKTTGMGIGASPALGGRNIYMIDSANCMIVMEPGREYKQIAKNTIEETVAGQVSNAAGEKNYWSDAHQEQTEATPIFEGNRIYIRGEQNLYCIADPTVAEKGTPAK